MPRSSMRADQTVTVYRFGLRGDLPQAAIEEIHRAHRLRNELVAIEQRYAERLAQLWSQHPTVAAAEQNLQAAEQDLQAASEAAAQERKDRQRPGQSPQMRQRLRDAKAVRRVAKAAVRDAKGAAYEAIKPQIEQARRERRAAIKAMYDTFRDWGGYWATYNEVVEHHQVAAQRIADMRKEGRPAQLRFHRWDGSGTIAVQLQRMAGDLVPGPQILSTDGHKWRNVAQITPYLTPTQWATWTRSEKRQAGRGTLRFRIGAGEHEQMIEMPLIQHRPMHPDAEIKAIKITRRVVAGHARCAASVVCRVPVKPARIQGKRAAVHLGWRRRPDGAVRVATVSCSTRPPQWLDGVMRPLGAHLWEVVAPADWEPIAVRLAEIAGQRDRNHDVAKAALIQWLSAQPVMPTVGDEPLTPQRVRQWRSPRRLARVATTWRGAPPPGGADIAQQLEDWRRQDRHLWEWHANLADQLGARRQDTWRKVAAWLCADAGQVVLDDWSVAQLAKIDETDDSYQAQGARRLRTLASPAGLREAVEMVCKRDGIELVRQTISGTVHAVCGTELEGDRSLQIMLHCSHCDIMVDQDVQTLERMLAGPAGGQAA